MNVTSHPRKGGPAVRAGFHQTCSRVNPPTLSSRHRVHEVRGKLQFKYSAAQMTTQRPQRTPAKTILPVPNSAPGGHTRTSRIQGRKCRGRRNLRTPPRNQHRNDEVRIYYLPSTFYLARRRTVIGTEPSGRGATFEGNRVFHRIEAVAPEVNARAE